MEFSGVFGSLGDVSGILILVEFSRFLGRRVDISRNLILVEFSRILRLVESGGFLRYSVNSYRNFRLVDPGRSFRF